MTSGGGDRRLPRGPLLIRSSYAEIDENPSAGIRHCRQSTLVLETEADIRNTRFGHNRCLC